MKEGINVCFGIIEIEAHTERSRNTDLSMKWLCTVMSGTDTDILIGEIQSDILRVMVRKGE
jgi:hypothetical protein